MLGEALAAAVEAGSWLLFSKSEARGPCCEHHGTCEDKEQLLLHGLSPSQEKGWERQGLGAAKHLNTTLLPPRRGSALSPGLELNDL